MDKYGRIVWLLHIPFPKGLFLTATSQNAGTLACHQDPEEYAAQAANLMFHTLSSLGCTLASLSQRCHTLAEQTEPADEVESNAVHHGPQPQVLPLPQRPGMRAQEVALENAAIPGAEPTRQSVQGKIAHLH